jgi:hypothetical protein
VDDTSGFSPAYSGWFGNSVVLLFVIRPCHIPIPCRIVGESQTDLRIQLQPDWEVDLRKGLILAVEEFHKPRNIMETNQPAEQGQLFK